MWLIVGTVPDADFALTPDAVTAQSRVDGDALLLPDGRRVPVRRGTAALAATALLACASCDFPAPGLLRPEIPARARAAGPSTPG